MQNKLVAIYCVLDEFKSDINFDKSDDKAVIVIYDTNKNTQLKKVFPVLYGNDTKKNERSLRLYSEEFREIPIIYMRVSKREYDNYMVLLHFNEDVYNEMVEKIKLIK